MEYNESATFRSSLAFNGTVSWSTINAELGEPNDFYASADLNVNFPDIDWRSLQEVYGWAALQWQGWARGEIYVQSETVNARVLHAECILEFWIDGEHFFGGDFYGFGRAPVTLHLKPGRHRIDVRLVRDVRAFGGIGEPSVDVKLRLESSYDGLVLVNNNAGVYGGLLISEKVGDDFGPLASPYASITLRNDGLRDVFVTAIEADKDHCEAELVHPSPTRLIPGQSRPLAFRLACIPPMNGRGPVYIDFVYRMDGDDDERKVRVLTWPSVRGRDQPHKMTFMHPAGVVSYAILRAPSDHAQCYHTRADKLPVLLALHGAGVEADSDKLKHALDPLPDLCAWIIFPTGGTSWSGDDWHTWGFADVEAAINAIPNWIDQVEWDGPGVDLDRWLVMGHSNGGQGAWYALTHRPDKVIAAAPLSGYSSIQNYVPYTFWHAADPGRTAIVQASLNSYRHELLLENAKDIPILQQHGSEDTNVPAYHSRMLSQRLQQADGESTYVEMSGKEHWWDGVMTTEPLADFYKENLDSRKIEARTPVNLRDFTVVSSGSGDMGPKNGVEILHVMVPGQLGRIHITFDPLTLACAFRTSNVRQFRLPMLFSECTAVMVDDQEVVAPSTTQMGTTLSKSRGQWQHDRSFPFTPERRGRQLGAMDAILRTSFPHYITYHSPAAKRIALQISRNLFQYYGADSNVTDTYADVTRWSGRNLISVAIGGDLPQDTHTRGFPITVIGNRLQVRDSDNGVHGYTSSSGLAAIWLQPVPGERLELVVWGADEDSLDVAARLVPLLTGTGQPDFVIADKTMLWKGLEGTLALGFFDEHWNVSKNSFFS